MKKIFPILATLMLSCSGFSLDFTIPNVNTISQNRNQKISNKTLNQLLEMSLFDEQNPDADLWSNRSMDIIKRLTKPSIRFARNSNKEPVYSARCSGFTIQQIPVEEIRIETKLKEKKQYPVKIDIFFINKGDTTKTKHLGKDINRAGKKLVKLFDEKLMPHTKQNYGAKEIKNKAMVWSIPQAVFSLEIVRNEYLILHINQPLQKKKSGKNNTFSLKTQIVRNMNLVDNVVKNDFGDVYIDNIPMIDQRDKGYCAPATVERVLRYYGIKNINMHKIADIAHSDRDDGTSVEKIHNALGQVFKNAEIKIKRINDLGFRFFTGFLDKGYPVLWCMRTNDKYEKRRLENTKERTSCSPREWKKKLKQQKQVPGNGGNHICLIIGYNMTTEEIAVSNSWGDRDSKPTWVSLRDAKKVSSSFLYVYFPLRENREAARKARQTKKRARRDNSQIETQNNW